NESTRKPTRRPICAPTSHDWGTASSVLRNGPTAKNRIRMISMAVPNSGTALDRPGMSLGAPGWNTPAMHRLKAASAQSASRTPGTERTSARSFDKADLSTPSQHTAGSRTDKSMMTAESNAGMGAMAILQED